MKSKKEQDQSPLYQQVKQEILSRISEGVLKPGMQIESELELVARLGMSRMTVNRALRELTNEGRLYRVRGHGTFVAARKPSAPLLEIRSVAEEIRDRGGSHSSKIHYLQEEKANALVAAELELPPYSPVYYAVISHMDNGVPIQLGVRYVLPAIAPDFLNQDFTRITVSEYLLMMAPVSSAEHTVEALIPEPWIRELLQITEGEPCLALQRKTWVGERVVTFSTFYFPGSRYKLVGRFMPPQDGSLGLT